MKKNGIDGDEWTASRLGSLTLWKEAHRPVPIRYDSGSVGDETLTSPFSGQLRNQNTD